MINYIINILIILKFTLKSMINGIFHKSTAPITITVKLINNI